MGAFVVILLVFKLEQSTSCCAKRNGRSRPVPATPVAPNVGRPLHDWSFTNRFRAGIHSGTCREKNEVTSKLGASIVLKGILGIEVNPDSIPLQTDEVGHDTIVEPLGVGAVAGVSVERDT